MGCWPTGAPVDGLLTHGPLRLGPALFASLLPSPVLLLGRAAAAGGLCRCGLTDGHTGVHQVRMIAYYRDGHPDQLLNIMKEFFLFCVAER